MQVSEILLNGEKYLRELNVLSNSEDIKLRAINNFLNYYIQQMGRIPEPEKRAQMKNALYDIFSNLLEIARNPNKRTLTDYMENNKYN